MAELSFNLADLFEHTFGYKTQAFQPDFSPVSGDRVSLRTEQGASGSPYYAKDPLGQEYFMPVTLIYPDNSNSSAGALKSWGLPYPVISISSRKTIIETALTERRGTVKELVNIQDYEIVIKGFIISQGNDFPENEVTTLRSIYEQNGAISIQCPLTDIFLLRPDRSGSDQVVITELKLPVVKGIKNVKPYELHMISDEPFNLISIS
jgi:Domain of unknown function (DUF6046)